MCADEDHENWNQILDYIDQFKVAIETNDVEAGRMVLVEAVNGYTPQCDVADLVQGKLTRTANQVSKSNIVNYPS